MFYTLVLSDLVTILVKELESSLDVARALAEEVWDLVGPGHIWDITWQTLGLQFCAAFSDIVYSIHLHFASLQFLVRSWMSEKAPYSSVFRWFGLILLDLFCFASKPFLFLLPLSLSTVLVVNVTVRKPIFLSPWFLSSFFYPIPLIGLFCPPAILRWGICTAEVLIYGRYWNVLTIVDEGWWFYDMSKKKRTV